MRVYTGNFNLLGNVRKKKSTIFVRMVEFLIFFFGRQTILVHNAVFPN